jgi:uncharacterized protein YjbI with pentapeptide repeats
MLWAIVNTPTWEILDLLIIPTVIAVGIWWLNKTDKENEREIAQRNREEDRKRADEKAGLERELALDKQRQDSLEQYLDRMSELLLDHQLRSLGVESDNRAMEARRLARAKTLAVLRTLDPTRKNALVQFLEEANLIPHFVSLRFADLRGLSLVEANLTGADLFGADLRGCTLDICSLSQANLTSANLQQAVLTGVDLSGAILARAHLEEANLSQAYLTRARLNGAWLNRAQLTGADLSHAVLHNAVLVGADLCDADFVACDLRGADLTSAVVSRAEERATTTGHRVLRSQARFTKAIFDADTKWPDYFDAEAAGAILVDNWGHPIEGPDGGE